MPRKKMSEEDKKTKITIRVNEILLGRIDDLLEKYGDKRSRLIERLLDEYIEENKSKL